MFIRLKNMLKTLAGVLMTAFFLHYVKSSDVFSFWLSQKDKKSWLGGGGAHL